MNAITLWRPWGTWIAWGFKTIETRAHARFRGLVGQRIAIHEGKSWDASAFKTVCRLFDLGLFDREPGTWRAIYTANEAAKAQGGICCTVDVIGAGWLEGTPDQDLAALCGTGPDRFGLFLEDVRRIDPPVPWKGAQGIWTVPDEVIPECAR